MPSLPAMVLDPHKFYTQTHPNGPYYRQRKQVLCISTFRQGLMLDAETEYKLKEFVDNEIHKRDIDYYLLQTVSNTGVVKRGEGQARRDKLRDQLWDKWAAVLGWHRIDTYDSNWVRNALGVFISERRKRIVKRRDNVDRVAVRRREAATPTSPTRSTHGSSDGLGTSLVQSFTRCSAAVPARTSDELFISMNQKIQGWGKDIETVVALLNKEEVELNETKTVNLEAIRTTECLIRRIEQYGEVLKAKNIKIDEMIASKDRRKKEVQVLVEARTGFAKIISLAQQPDEQGTHSPLIPQKRKSSVDIDTLKALKKVCVIEKVKEEE